MPSPEADALSCRSFWRAGSYEVSAASRSLQGELESGDFDRARVHPKFLHSNATSHKWAFGAIAELLDNAVDEICNGATFVMVDKIINPRDNGAILLFRDDGGGMDPEGIRRCMSLGFSTKKSKKTIGQYGNGFKTSTMRLGADAIVFTRANRESSVTQSIGLLSYTFLRRTMKDDIIVPMVDFQNHGASAVPLTYSSQDDWDDSLKTILEWSPFSSKEDILHQGLVSSIKIDVWSPKLLPIISFSSSAPQPTILMFEDIGPHGTKVLIYNLWMNDDGLLELDFDDNDEDILLRDQENTGGFSRFHKEIVQTHISYTLRYSLRAYASILYLRKFSNFQIILRGKPVEQIKIAEELKFIKVVTYKPQLAMGTEDVSVRTTIGFAKEAPVLGIFGINVYHKNRLIMPFWKVVQEGSSRGRCVVGVLEANFIEPAHDKQDFERTPLFIRLEAKLRQIILDYWKNHCHLIGYQALLPDIRTRQKGDTHSQGSTPKGQQKMLSGQRVKGPSANVHSTVQVEEAVIDVEDIVELDAVNGTTEPPSAQAHNVDSGMETYQLLEDCEENDPVDILNTNSIEKMSEENIHLFSRREELQHREAQLKQTIEQLECQLGEAKRKCSQLSSELENRKKQLQAQGRLPDVL